MTSTQKEITDKNQCQKATEAVFVPTKLNHSFDIKVQGIFQVFN